MLYAMLEVIRTMTHKRRYEINPGDSSFVSYGILSQELTDFILELTGGEKESYYGNHVGGVRIYPGGIVGVTSTIDEYYTNMSIRGIFFPSDWDDRTEEEIAEDIKDSQNVQMMTDVISTFLPGMTPDRIQRLAELLAAGLAAGNVISRVYYDQRDSFEYRPYFPSDFALLDFELDQDGNVVKCIERPGRKGIVHIPGSRTIRDGAFCHCRNTTHVTTDNFTTLEPGAFSGCVSLQELKLSPTHHDIPARLCSQCEALRRVELPPILYTIRENAFAGCKNLEEIAIPDTVLFIHETAFAGCEKLPAAVREKIKTLPSEEAFNRQVAEALDYVRSHGDAGFPFSEEKIGELFLLLPICRKWQELYGVHFDYPEKLPMANVVYTWCGKPALDMTQYGWKYQQSLGKKVNVLLMDIDRIPFIGSTIKNYPEHPERDGKSKLSKAIELKLSGHPIQIISKSHLERCLRQLR